MLESSNPNRSVLINKSLIASKKNFSDSELSDEDFSFDQGEPETVNGSILGSVRSNLIETVYNGTENSGRLPRSNNQSIDGSRLPSQFESKIEYEKGSTRQNSQRFGDIPEGKPQQ